MTSDVAVVILANGRFPTAEHCLDILEKAEVTICCDEAADALIRYGKEPDVIIGDMDSVSARTMEKYNDRVIRLEEQETNDLTKAVNFCIGKGYREVTILGATGLREDHTLGNISLLLEYNMKISARMVSDHGEFSILNSGNTVRSYPGEQFSFFSVDNRITVRSTGLKYQLENLQLYNWWRASLNEADAEEFTLFFEADVPLIMFRLIR